MKRSLNCKWYISGLGVLLVLSLAALFISGCSTKGLQPDPDNNNENKLYWLNSIFEPPPSDCSAPMAPGTQSTFTTGVEPVLPANATAVAETTVTQLVGPLGSTILVSFGPEPPASFRVPYGALDAPVLITIHAYKVDSPYGPMYVYDCGPDGTVFKVPLQLTQSFLTNKTLASLFYFNEATGQWEVEQTSRVQSRAASFQIYHFSRYGIS